MGRISCTAMHSTCTPVSIHLSAHPFLCTHICPQPFPHTCGHLCLGPSHAPVHTGMCLYACPYVNAHP